MQFDNMFSCGLFSVSDFFADLSAMVCPLALNSTMTELVHYTRQGLQWLRLESNVT